MTLLFTILLSIVGEALARDGAAAAALLRGPGDAGAGQEVAALGTAQVLVILSLVVLLVLLAVLVAWRMRRTRSK